MGKCIAGTTENHPGGCRMMTATRQTHLIDTLPAVRGSLEADVSLARFTWFKVGGNADVMFRPADTEDLAAFLKVKPKDIPVTVIGTASNLLIRDGGVRGVVIRLGRGFSSVEARENRIVAGAGAVDLNIARKARDAGLTGLEFMASIPGTMGGALRMNAGAYGGEIKDVFVSATAVDLNGEIHQLDFADMGFAYRRTDVPMDWIFVSGKLRGIPGEISEITSRMEDIKRQREEAQPVRTCTGGSTFKNPDGGKAWELVDQAGCRGLRRGGAMVSEQHCNFLLNDGNASAADLEGLGEEVRRRVFEKTGVTLEWEIKRIGDLSIPERPISEMAKSELGSVEMES